MKNSDLEELREISLAVNRDEIYCLKPLEAETVSRAVRKNGIVVFPRFLDETALPLLNLEFDSMIDLHRTGDSPFATDSYGSMINVRVIRDHLDISKYSVLAHTFASPVMDAVAACYFGAGAYRLNGEIFVTELGEGMDSFAHPPFVLHFDKRQVLKFYFYLSDTDEKNGAMRASPGTNHIIRRLRLEAMERNNLDEIDNVLSDEHVHSIPISGPAGTLIVFDTDVAHGAGRVCPGLQRRTIRGHTHSNEMLRAMGLKVH